MKLATLHGPLQVGVEHLRPLPPSRFDQAAPMFFDPRRPHNTGDWYLTKIVDRLLDHDTLVTVFADSSDAAWDEVNETCDAVILRGGNVLTPRFLSKQVGLELIRRVRIPIVLFGAGVQDVPSGGVPFTDEDIAILRAIGDSGGTTAVRGDLSAEVLASVGVHNTIVTGCPTLYWSRRPELPIRKPAAGRAGFTFRQGLFTDDPAAYAAMFDALAWARRTYDDVTVLLQGEEVALQQLLMVETWGVENTVTVSREPGHVIRLRRNRLDPEGLRAEVRSTYGRWASQELVDWLIERAFFSWDIADHLDTLSRCDVVVGCRLHGNLLALAHGTPTYFLTYDDRTRELAALLDVPASPLHRFADDVAELGDLSELDWAPVERRYRTGFGELVRFLDANRLAHRLAAAPDGTSVP